MYAIIADGPHQFRVEEGQLLEVHLKRQIAQDAKTLSFDQVLMIGDTDGQPKVGRPHVESAKVTATILGEVKGQKLVIQKIKRRKGYRLKTGHRQRYLRVKVDKIEA